MKGRSGGGGGGDCAETVVFEQRLGDEGELSGQGTQLGRTPRGVRERELGEATSADQFAKRSLPGCCWVSGCARVIGLQEGAPEALTLSESGLPSQCTADPITGAAQVVSRDG